jgi:hypothetical protein
MNYVLSMTSLKSREVLEDVLKVLDYVSKILRYPLAPFLRGGKDPPSLFSRGKGDIQVLDTTRKSFQTPC